MFFSLLQTNPQFYFAVILVVVISICLHELAHGFTAIYFGDETPAETGHITMNPLVHMGGISLVMLALVGISWGRMPVNPSRMRGRHADAIVSAAGPLTNLTLAFLGMTILGLWERFGTIDRANNHIHDNLFTLLSVAGLYNLVLFALNLLPLPPLDGSRIVASYSRRYRNAAADPTMQGVFLALTFGALWSAGTYLMPQAAMVMRAYVGFVAGH